MRGFLFLLLFGILGPAHAQVFDRLYENSPQPVLAQPLSWVAAPKGSVASPDAFADTTNWNFRPYGPDTIVPTSAKQEVWARFALPATATPQTWFVRIPRQTIVKVSLYARDMQGNWRSQSAGEAIAPAQWAIRTRVPSFELQTRNDAETIYYLRFEHRVAITERPMLLSTVDYIDGSSRVGLVIGLIWGLFGLLAMLCVAAFAITRNKVFLWFGASVVTLLFTQLVFIGYGGWRMWPQSAHLNQAMPWVSSALTLATGAWFCAQASYARDSHPRIYRLLTTVAAGSLVLAGLTAIDPDLVPRPWRNLWAAGAALSMIGSLVWLSLRGQTWNLLLLAASAPIILAALMRVSYNAGWVMHIEIAQTAGILSALVGLLCIFLALAWRSRNALLAGERAAALATYDPVTGLMLPHVVDIRLPQMLLRAGRLKPGCGVLLLRWLEYSQTPAQPGNDRRSLALARIGAILRGVSRDVDTVVRYGEDEFIMLVEGPVNRNALSEVATQILASCIRFSEKSDGANSATSFNMHIAIWHGGSGIYIVKEVIDELKARLLKMSSGTSRPVQFVDAATKPSTLPDEDVMRHKKDLIAKIDALETSYPAPVASIPGPELTDESRATH